jgi:hypothetical protein
MSEDNTQHSLTSPADRVTNPTSVSYQQAVTLSNDDVSNAMKELVVTEFTKKFPRVEKFYADPSIPNQVFSLVSFVPSKGATPDEDGVFGMVKVRGNYATEDEAMLKAEDLIRNVDSYHSIYTTYVGRPFPLASTKKYVRDTTEVDIKKKVVEETSKEVRKKRDEERKIMKEMEEREKELIADVEKKEEDPYDLYTELMVKKAQLTWTYSETRKKMDEMKNSIIKTRADIVKMKDENPAYHEQYMDRYMTARKKAGLPSDDNSFMKYMAEDLDLGF